MKRVCPAKFLWDICGPINGPLNRSMTIIISCRNKHQIIYIKYYSHFFKFQYPEFPGNLVMKDDRFDKMVGTDVNS